MKIKIFILILFLLPFFIISLFNQPAIDDFWSANIIHDHCRMGAVSYFYQTVSARFFSNFLMSFCNTLPNGKIWIFKVWPIIIIILLAASFNFLYISLFEQMATTKELLLASIFFVVIYIANMRTLFETLYWMSSTICYQVAICLFAVGFGSLIRCLKAPSFLYGFAAVSCSLLLPGSAEIIVPVFIILLLVILFISVKQKHPLQLTITCITAAVCSLAFVALSKGNNLRVEKDAAVYDQNILYAFFYSARAVGYYGLVWLVTPINIASLMLLLPALQKLSVKMNFPMSLYYNPVVLIPLFYFICIVIYLPFTYFESAVPFPRVTAVVFFIAAHLAFITMILLLNNNSGFNRFVSYLLSIKNFRLYAWILFFLTAFTSRNFLAVVKDLFSGNAYNYNIEATNRYQILRNAKSDTCYVPLYVHWPYFIQSSKKETDNSNSFIHMDKYFGKTILYEKSKK